MRPCCLDFSCALHYGPIGTILHRRRDGTVRSYTVVDDADFDWLDQWRWSDSHGYAMRVITREGVRTVIWLHRLVMGLEPSDPREVDHMNGNTYNSRRSNLRIVTHHVNGQNRRRQIPWSSSYRGVSWNKRAGKWVAQCRWDNRNHWLGYFDSEEEAAHVAQMARNRHMPGALT